MPTRLIRDKICKSESIDELTWFEEVFFYRLITLCDDFGRYDARPKVLKADLFPLKDGVTLSQIENALNKLSTVGMVQVYMYDQKPFLQLVTWEKYQNVRNHKSKYPQPPSLSDGITQLNTNEYNCIQSPANAPVIQSESESESESKSESEGADALSHTHGQEPASGFDSFWSAYPKKVGKGAAQKAWKKIKPNKELVAKMLEAVAVAKTSRQWLDNGGQFIPHPATWLNQERWEDEPFTAPNGNTTTKRNIYAELAEEARRDELESVVTINDER